MTSNKRGQPNTQYPTAQERLMEAEWKQWMELCKALKELGAVTEQDARSRRSATATPGQRLFARIRNWGDTLVALRQETTEAT